MNISRLRDTADYLFEENKYNEAYIIYDEISKQIWCAIGTAQNGLNEFSQEYLNMNIRVSLEFRKSYNTIAANNIFQKWFNLDMDQLLNEFIFTLVGHLRTISYTQNINKVPIQQIYLEYLTLFNLILYGFEEDWISKIYRIATPQIYANQLKSIRSNLPEHSIKKMILELAVKMKETDWSYLNQEIVNYLVKTGDNVSDFYLQLKSIIGSFSSNNNSSNSKKNRHYQKYERYEKYEKYERYEEYSHKSSNESNKEKEYDISKADDLEKSRYYGKVLGLQGKVTKGQIRKHYIDMIGKYHPDKVESLGEEILELAERKTKEINEAYEWLKIKYSL